MVNHNAFRFSSASFPKTLTRINSVSTLQQRRWSVQVMQYILVCFLAVYEIPQCVYRSHRFYYGVVL